MPESPPSTSEDPITQGRRFDFPAGRIRILTIAFTLLWFAGWLFLLLLLALDYVRFGSVNVVGITFLVIGGVPAAVALLWCATGKRESLLVTPGELRIYRWVGPLRLTRSIGAARVVGVRAAAMPSGLESDFFAVREFYGAGRGGIAIDTTTRTLTVGHTVSGERARQIVEEVRQFLPQLTVPPAGTVPRRRPTDYLSGMMTASLIGFAVTTPARLLLIDRPICFYDESVRPRQPIDVSRIHVPGRIYLVPIDDFPPERAAAIAEHFRTKYGLTVDVTPPVSWPDGAYVEERRQMNSEVMLTRLEEMYARPGTQDTAIGLTTRDIFNPEVNWAYVFSYRHERVAVVSPARMDRGCMGLPRASDDRIMARLRKMIGKDIGILHYGLEVNRDPASMLYGNIGGPQELDAMSESF